MSNSTQSFIVFRCPNESANAYVCPMTNIGVPAVLRREHPTRFMKQHVLVEVALIVPQSLHVILFILHDALVAGLSQGLHALPRPSKHSCVIVEIPLFHVRHGFGVAVIRVETLWEAVVVGVEQSHRLPQSLRTKPSSKHLVHVEAEHILGVVADIRLDGFGDGLHPHHGDVLPAGVSLHTDDLHPSLGTQLHVPEPVWAVRKHIIGDGQAQHEVTLC